MVKKDVMELVLDEMEGGKRDSFQQCELIMEGISFKKRIPESFWNDENKAGLGIMDIYNPLTKLQLRQIRIELMYAIIQRLENEDTLSIEDYARYFHGLSILKVPKDTNEVPAIGENIQYNIAYELWKLDDGSEKNWNHIESVVWYASEHLNP